MGDSDALSALRRLAETGADTPTLKISHPCGKEEHLQVGRRKCAIEMEPAANDRTIPLKCVFRPRRRRPPVWFRAGMGARAATKPETLGNLEKRPRAANFCDKK